MAKVFVKNIPYEADETKVIEALSGYGPISSCELNQHKRRRNWNAGSGYVEFRSEKDATDCIAKTPFDSLRPKCMGRPLHILPIKPKKKVEAESTNVGIAEKFTLSSMEIGNWSSALQEDDNTVSSFTFLSEWKYPEDYIKPRIYFSKEDEAIILEGFNLSDVSDQINLLNINPNPNPESIKKRIKIPFRILAENSRGIFLDTSDDVISLYINLRQPPYLYRNVNSFVRLISLLSLNKQGRTVEWIRTVDWTGVIGKSLVYKLIFRDNLDELRNSLEKFKFKGVPRPIPQITVRCIEKPASSIEYFNSLPFNICFKLEGLISYGILRPYEIEEYRLGERLSELIYDDNQEVMAMHALNQISTNYWDPFDIKHLDRPITIFETAINNFRNEFSVWYPSSPNFNLTNNSRFAWVNHATITPTNIYFDGPSYEPSNRILRLYQDKTEYFMRVTFTEENFDKLFVNKDEDVDIINLRIMSIMIDGFDLTGRHFEFLAFSSSQLKDVSCWFVASDGEFNADSIRANMGDFSNIKAPALYAARMGQCFTSTMGMLELDRDQIIPIDDIKRNNYVFSDGCGKISSSLAARAAKAYYGTMLQNDDEIPSVYQFRLGGSKGMVAVDKDLEGDFIHIRPSQTKFEAPNSLNLEIVRSVRNPLPGHLNRQVISMLSTLGVQDHVFITLQEEMCKDIDSIMINENKARQIVRRSTGTRECSHIMRTIVSMIDAGCMRKKETFEPFLKALLECKRIFSLKLLRCKARILVPNSFLLMGVIDETGTLEEDEIYIQTSTIISENQTFDTAHHKIKREYKVLSGQATIIRNPSLHPGDFRKVKVVGECSQLSHLKNCVVFSQKGDRPLPNLLSGGDLDGDEYFVCFDERLFVSENEEPMNYDPPERKTIEGRPVEITDICEFFKDFMLNNKLGQIANLHLALGDHNEEGGKFLGCKMLAELHSKAVDFNKTGVPVTENLPALEKYPDFMEKDHKKSYESTKVLGQLYRNIKLEKPENDPLLSYDVETIVPNDEFLFDGYEHYLKEAKIYRDQYNGEIRNLMKKYKIKTEAEVITAQLLGRQVDGKKSQDIREAISGSISIIIYNCRRQFLMGLQDTNEEADVDNTPFNLHVSIPINDETKAKASAWYYVTYNKPSGKTILLSFPWAVADVLLAIKKEKDSGIN